MKTSRYATVFCTAEIDNENKNQIKRILFVLLFASYYVAESVMSSIHFIYVNGNSSNTINIFRFFNFFCLEVCCCSIHRFFVNVTFSVDSMVLLKSLHR